MAAPPLAPTGVFTYPGDTQIQDILLLPDGRHALALFRVGSVNLWSVLAYHWVEIAAAIAVGALLVVLLHLIRRPRESGKPYCRRCNYLLVGSDAQACPECGLDLAGRNRVIGRSRRARFVVVAVLLAMVGGGYVMYDRPSSDGNISTWCPWLSPRLYNWAYHSDQQWLLRHKSWLCRVVEIDLADGSVTRTLFTRDGIVAGEFALHPGGASFFLSEGDAVSQFDLDSGRRIASMRAEDVGLKRFQQVTVDVHGDTVYTATMDHEVWAWHPGDGSHREVFDHPKGPLWLRVILVPYRDRAVLQGSVFIHPEHGRSEAEMGGPPGIRSLSTLQDLGTQQRVGSLGFVGVPARVSQDGRWIVSPNGEGFGVWDVDTGEQRQSIPAPWAAGDPEIFMVGADARFVVLPKYRPPELRLWDIEKSAWAGSFTGPVTLWFRARLSADRTRMVALGLNVTGGQTQFKILIWDLPP